MVKLHTQATRLIKQAIFWGLLFILVVNHSLGQRRLGNSSSNDQRVPRPASSEAGEFTFVRTVYRSPNSGWRYDSWATDFPDADDHFVGGIRDWTNTKLSLASRTRQLPIMNEQLFNYPLIYFVEPGFLELSEEEAARLREYIARGGFIFLDDFWGEYEWQNVQEQLKRVLPDLEIKDLPLDHPLFHCYLDIDEVLQVPGMGSWFYRGVTHEKGGVVPHYMGIEDKSGRLVVFIARNSDLGDAWEHIDDPRYPVKYGLAAYKLGINVIIYAMSH
ncbi:MAG: DUF4159 domain-containing protein [Pyrinomonadaceae bacterium]|nr:DUF4159 domain-containing protein [Pyrinomonadaceae bacterium]